MTFTETPIDCFKSIRNYCDFDTAPKPPKSLLPPKKKRRLCGIIKGKFRTVDGLHSDDEVETDSHEKGVDVFKNMLK
jgi:hypothetical protein